MAPTGRHHKQNIRSYLELFATTTVIRGFSFIKLSKSWIERLFWIALVITFAILTVTDVGNSVKKYLREPTVSETTIRKNESVSLRNPNFCLQFNFEAFKFKFDLSDEQNLVNLLVDTYKDANITSLFEERLNLQKRTISLTYKPIENVSETNSILRIHDTAITNSSDSFLSLFYVSAALVLNIQRLENPVATQGLKDPNRKLWGLTDPRTKWVNTSTTASLLKMNKFLSMKNVNYKHLAKQMAALLCAQLNIKLFKIEVDMVFYHFPVSVEFPCAIQNSFVFGGVPTIPGITMLCMRVKGSETFFFHKSDTSAGLMFNTEHLYAKGFKSDDLFLVVDFYKSFGAKFMEYTFATTQAWSAYYQTSISGFYKSVSVQRRPCGDISYNECHQGCSVRMIQQRCKCDPVSGFQIASQSFLPVCGSDNNVSHPRNNLEVPHLTAGDCENLTLGGLGSHCDDNCFESCTTLVLSHTFRNRSRQCGQFPNYNCLMIEKIVTFTFPDVTEKLSMDFRDLITSLGGNLSLWLGASFLALIHIVVFFIKIPIEKCLERNAYALQ